MAWLNPSTQQRLQDFVNRSQFLNAYVGGFIPYIAQLLQWAGLFRARRNTYTPTKF